MSKYIVELKPEYEDSFKGLMILGAKDSNLFIHVLAANDVELLNSDYINEHFAVLQETAYQKGFEDGKALEDNGCEGCRYEPVEDGGYPCSECANACLNYYMPKLKDDKIKAGDEVKQVTESGTETGLLCTVTAIDGDHMNGISQDGRAIVCSSQVNRWWKKTGRHFNIASILEEMRND